MVTKRMFLIAIGVFHFVLVYSQDSLIAPAKPGLFSFSVFAESYYGYDFTKPQDNNRPAFIYSHNRHNEFNINLAYLKGSYTADRIRGNLAIAAGTYVNANYAAEPGVLKNLYEANAGLKLARNANLWIDAGIFSSHIGFESAHSPSCWTLTRSMVADNSPYYETGAKITYGSANEKWLISALALNGWQRIQRVPGNSLMSWGSQFQFKPSDKVLLNYSNFLGTDKPDSARLWRYYHNLYSILQPTSKIGVIIGLDIGQEQVSKGNSDLNTWFSPVVIFRYKPNERWAIAVRGEYYEDEHGVIIPTMNGIGFKTFGASLNVDRVFDGKFWWRVEIRTLNNKDGYFVKENEPVNNNLAITTSFAFVFND